MSKYEDIPEVTPAVAAEQWGNGSAIIVDVREHEELAQARIDGVLHIPLGELHLKIESIPQDTDVYMLCHVGQRSAMATDFLRQVGHTRVWNIRGGIIGWARSGLPIKMPGED